MSARNVVDRILDYHKIEDYFDVVMTADDVLNGKPDPEILWKTIEQLDKDVKCTLYVGDAAHDLEAAIRLGVPFLLTDTGIYRIGSARKRLGILAKDKGFPVVGSQDICEIAMRYHLIAND